MIRWCQNCHVSQLALERVKRGREHNLCDTSTNAYSDYTHLLHMDKYYCIADLLFDWFGFDEINKSKVFRAQGKTSGRTLFLLVYMMWLAQSWQSCLMMQMDEKSSWPCMTSLDECMQARITRAHLFYLGQMTLDKSVDNYNIIKAAESEHIKYNSPYDLCKYSWSYCKI